MWRQGRSQILQSTNIFDSHSEVVLSQEKFLSNEYKKSRFISHLSRKVNMKGISVTQITDDEDLLNA